jgi:hypothetical protein
MFRYGGPIKEGVMSGIREPHANGGRAALVGNPVFPQRGGRALHAEDIRGIFNVAKDATKKTLTTNPLKVVNPLGKRGKMANVAKKYWPKIKNFYNKQISKLDMPPRGVDVGGKLGPAYAGVGQRPLSLLEKAKYFATKNPKTTIGGAYVASPAVVGGLTSIPYKKAGMQILDLAVPDFIFDQDKYFADKEKDKLDEEKALTANELRIKQLEKLLAAKKEPAVPQKSDAEIRQDQIQKYRDIMDIKGMNKEAAYDSLIAASQAINESGDFKGDIKSGKLINQIIQGASKAFDKPKKTKDAIDTLILKGEIEKDLNKDKNAIMDAYRMKQIELADKQLNESLTEKAIKFAGTMKKPYVDQETAIMTIRDQFDTTPNIVLSEKEMEEVKKQDDYTNETDVFTKIVDKQTLGPGYYVMGSSGFVVDEGGNIKQIL